MQGFRGLLVWNRRISLGAMSTSPVGSRLAVALPDMQPLLQGASLDRRREVRFVFYTGSNGVISR